jgi:alkylated DNA repair protein (DNA oxidative demethylase)
MGMAGQPELFPRAAAGAQRSALGEGACLLPGFALGCEREILSALAGVLAPAPLRHMVTPGGFRMSVAMSNCGSLGWVTDRRGYRYTETDPESGRRWPPMPAVLRVLAEEAARRAGFERFAPDACLLNRYQPGAKMSLHQDRNERDLGSPIVSVSLGLTATFLFGGLERSDKPLRIPLEHGDVVVWGGPARLRFHGILPLKAGPAAPPGADPAGPPAVADLLRQARVNLTFRRAG